MVNDTQGVFNTPRSHASAWEQVVREGLETRIGWIVLSEFVILALEF